MWQSMNIPGTPLETHEMKGAPEGSVGGTSSEELVNETYPSQYC